MSLVFIFHFMAVLSAPGAPSNVLSGAGYLGTCMFLVLAGHTAQSHLTHVRSAWQYWRVRFWRLYPLYAAVLASYLLVGAYFPGIRASPGADGSQVLSDLLLVTEINGGAPIMDGTWALQYIAIFSLVAPLVWRLSKTQPGGVARCALLFTLFLAVATTLAAGGYHRPRAALLLAGPLLFEAFAAALPVWSVVTGLAGLAAVLASTLSGSRVWLMPLAVGLVWVGLHPRCPFSLRRTGGNSRLWWISQHSYGFYLTQGFVMAPLRMISSAIGPQSWWVYCLLSIPCVAVNLLLAYGVHRAETALKSRFAAKRQAPVEEGLPLPAHRTAELEAALMPTVRSALRETSRR